MYKAAGNTKISHRKIKVLHYLKSRNKTVSSCQNGYITSTFLDQKDQHRQATYELFTDSHIMYSRLRFLNGNGGSGRSSFN